MTSTQFSTIIRLFAEQNKYIDKRFKQMDERFKKIDKKFEEEAKKRHAEHQAIIKAIEEPFLEHDKRIAKLENVILHH